MLNRLQVMEQIDKLIHDNNLCVAIVLGDKSGCVTHVCDEIPDEALHILSKEILEHMEQRQAKLN